MNNKAIHWSKEDLAAFVTGELTELENETILMHLEKCEQCFSIVDSLWEEGGWQHPDSNLHLDISAAARLEGKLYGRIHRSQLAGDVVTLGTRGMLKMVFALLAPFVGMFSPSKSDEHKERKKSDAKP
ncbi:MAG: zf-HC2 domain-containing protein [Chloroflexi bacterium]|nr:MAG: zf-HC2 domain-containing protein [Chloroflexota bacterium]MBL1195094.1 zf-HC2 domain-containing protein [Chloroflexota bacterium]NOH12380.1 zf-HC2 domain-containing protein [Chloroflexota bacterium]